MNMPGKVDDVINAQTVCLCCHKPMEYENIGGTERKHNHIGIVYDGVICRTYGNFGSTTFDPSPGEDLQFIEFVICDDCFAFHFDALMKSEFVPR